MSDAYVPASEFVICCASATDYVNPHQSPSPSPFWVLSDYFLAHCIGFRRAVIESAALFSCLKIQQWLVFHLTNEQRIRAFREAIASLFVVPPPQSPIHPPQPFFSSLSPFTVPSLCFISCFLYLLFSPPVSYHVMVSFRTPPSLLTSAYPSSPVTFSDLNNIGGPTSLSKKGGLAPEMSHKSRHRVTSGNEMGSPSLEWAPLFLLCSRRRFMCQVRGWLVASDTRVWRLILTVCIFFTCMYSGLFHAFPSLPIKLPLIPHMLKLQSRSRGLFFSSSFSSYNLLCTIPALYHWKGQRC